MEVHIERGSRTGRTRRTSSAYSREETGFRWMYVADAVSLFALVVLITLVRFGWTWPNYSRMTYLGGFCVAVAVHMVVAYFGGLYDREARLGNPSRLTKVWGVCALAVLIDAALSLGADPFLMPRLNLVVFALTSTLVLTFNRWLAQRLRTARFGRPRVLLVGNPDDIDLVEAHLDETDRDAVVVGRRGPKEDLLAAVEATEATDVLLLSGCELSSIYPNPLGLLETRRIGVYHRLEPSDTLLGLKKTRQIAGVPFVAVRSHALPPSKAHLKRVLDVFYIVAASPLILPLVALLTLYTRLVAGGPVFYRQTRTGRYDEPFRMVKFRTMYPGSEDESGPVLATADDARIIPAMRWLRAMRLDELPQLWNVLRGEMSLVGPRPERPELAEQFEMLIPGYGRRHDIRPGITGLAQVNGHYHTDPGYKLGHDLQYLVNWSPIADLQVLLRSVLVVLSRRA